MLNLSEHDSLIHLSKKLDRHVLNQTIWEVILRNLSLDSSKHQLNWIESWSVLRNSERHELPILKEITNRLSKMKTSIVKQKHNSSFHEIPIVSVVLFQSSLQIDQKHQPFSCSVCAHSHCTKVYSLICQCANGRWRRPIWIFIDWIILLFLNPRVKFHSSRVEWCLIYPNESAFKTYQRSKEFHKNLSVFLNIRSISISV